MSADLFGVEIPVEPVKHLKQGGYARRPGTGPANETCGTCANCIGTGGGRKTFYKCAVVRHRWTRGPGTDILKRTSACELWQAQAATQCLPNKTNGT